MQSFALRKSSQTQKVHAEASLGYLGKDMINSQLTEALRLNIFNVAILNS